jgi:hypothetical protein
MIISNNSIRNNYTSDTIRKSLYIYDRFARGKATNPLIVVTIHMTSQLKDDQNNDQIYLTTYATSAGM